MNDNPRDLCPDCTHQQALAEHTILLQRYSIAALAELLTGQAPGNMLRPEPLAALMSLIEQAGEQPHVAS